MEASLHSLPLALEDAGAGAAVDIRPASRRAAMHSHIASRVTRQTAARRRRRRSKTTTTLSPSISKKRNAIAAGALRTSRRKPAAAASGDGLEKKIRMLQQLIPNCEHSSDDDEGEEDDDGYKGIDGLFREAVDYILCLEMKVRAMKIIVTVLSPKD